MTQGTPISVQSRLKRGSPVEVSPFGAAPKGLGSTGDARYNRLWTLMGVPCVNVPTLVAEGGLPVGVTIIARYGADAKALAAARFVEQALKSSKS